MHINITLIIQMLVFITFVWFTMRFVWPPLSKALEERQTKIADGLAAAERGQRELELAQHRVTTELKQAKAQAHDIIEKANLRAGQLIDEAKEAAKQEAQKQLKVMQAQFSQEVNQVKNSLKLQLAHLVVEGAEKIIQQEISAEKNKKLLDQLIEEM